MVPLPRRWLLISAFLFSFGNIYVVFTNWDGATGLQRNPDLLAPSMFLLHPVPATAHLVTKWAPSTTIDILSTGTIERPEYQNAQERTFGSHFTVRQFVRLTEFDDSEKDCSTNLTQPIAERIIYYCGRRIKPYKTLERIKRLYATKQYMQKKTNWPGWFCAQKRPLDGFQRLLKQYQSPNGTIPDYLIFVDDDTYMNMDHVVPFVKENYPAAEAHAVAGCLLRPRFTNFTLAYGGWSTILTRPTIEQFLLPIHCAQKNTTDEFTQKVCDRLAENGIGEQPLFREGMSVADLMYAYVTDQLYTNFLKWNKAGYCLHSDQTLAYFLNFYYISSLTDDPKFQHIPMERIKGYNNSYYFVGRQRPGQRVNRKQCLHKNDDSCTSEAHVCHYINPEHMDLLHKELVDRVPNQFRSRVFKA
jgi:hypothetical protein